MLKPFGQNESIEDYTFALKLSVFYLLLIKSTFFLVTQSEKIKKTFCRILSDKLRCQFEIISCGGYLTSIF